MSGAKTAAELRAGTDFRQPRYRREVFLRFYAFHLRHRAHPGCVYYLIPYLRDRYGWSDDEALWFAFINGNTQNPVTSLLLHRAAPTPDRAGALLEFFARNYERLAFDTDRRHHKKRFGAAVESYRNLVHGNQVRFWRTRAAHGFASVWTAATSIATFGRLSAFSYAEYLRVVGLPFDCETLFLDDRSGSRSHRNGLALVCGLDEYDWHASNPSFDGRYSPDLIAHFDVEARRLLDEARRRAVGEPWARDVDLFTLESALCTYKSWHRPNRRYPNVYNDLLYDRLVKAEAAWPDAGLGVFWDARRAALPAHLRLEDTPTDPGCVPMKQNHYRLTGEPVMMDREWPCFANGFNDGVRAGRWGRFR